MLIAIVLGVVAVLVTVLVCVVLAGRVRDVAAPRDRAAFEERHPPISDAEFLARCSPGVSREVALKVRRIVADYFGLDYERVYPEMTFVEDLGA